MSKPDVTFYLALWASVLSTVTALLDLLKYRQEGKASLGIAYHFEPDASAFTFRLTNTSQRPLSVLGYDILYGTQPDYAQLVHSYTLEPPVKLQESEVHRQQFTAAELQAAAQQHNVQQRYYHRLFVRILTSNAGVYHRLVDLPPLKSASGATVEQPYMCADIYLGLPEKQPQLHRWEHTPTK